MTTMFNMDDLQRGLKLRVEKPDSKNTKDS